MSLEKSKNPRDVITVPVASKKLYACMDRSRYTFIVALGSSKTEVKQAVETISNVKVSLVSTISRKGKTYRIHAGIGKSKDTHRAIVILRERTVNIFGNMV